MAKHKIITLVILRVVFGLLFLYSGVDKLLSDFSAESYLNFATDGPFVQFYANLAGNTVVDFLVVWGEILIGLALILGLAIRFTSVMGIVMMTLFYITVLPPVHGPITEHIIYILVFLLLAIFESGRYFGLDSWISKQEFFKNNIFLKYFVS